MTDKYIRSGLQSFYSAAQVQAYLRRINFQGDVSSFHPNLKNLEQLVRLHLLGFPFENTRLHYAATHEVDVSPEFVYNRLVEQGKGGTWCCGHNGLFLGVLRGLGYRGYAASGRVNQSPPAEEAKEFTFLSHLVLIVQLDDELPEENRQRIVTGSDADIPMRKTYLVDVGFGGTGIVRPVPLEAGRIVPGSAPPEEHRLVRGLHPQSSLQETESSCDWVLQYRCGSHQPEWTVLYLFRDTEAFPNDWIAYSQWLSAHPVERFAHNVICVTHFVAEDESERHKDNDAPLGRLVMMGRRVQKRVGAESRTVEEFTTESERVRILKEHFGIIVDQDEVQNIANTPAALPP